LVLLLAAKSFSLVFVLATEMENCFFLVLTLFRFPHLESALPRPVVCGKEEEGREREMKMNDKKDSADHFGRLTNRASRRKREEMQAAELFQGELLISRESLQ